MPDEIGETELRESDIWGTKNECAERHFDTWIMLPENFIGLFTKLQIEPTQFTIVSAHYEMVSWWVHIHGRYPLDSRNQRLDKFLFREIVDADILLCLLQILAHIKLNRLMRDSQRQRSGVSEDGKVPLVRHPWSSWKETESACGWSGVSTRLIAPHQ